MSVTAAIVAATVAAATVAAATVTTAARRINCDSSSSTFHRRQDLAEALAKQSRAHAAAAT